MKATELNKDIQRAYHSLVDYVEERVVKEGQDLQVALYSAEAKLSEWNDLSKEQIQDVSEELRRNFQTLDQSLDGAREAFKEQFKLDAAYVTDSIWRKLLAVMDANTAQLIAFQQDLRDQVEEVTSAKHTSEHQEHMQWASDHELWLYEVSLWKKQQTEAVEKLGEIKQLIKEYSARLDEHAQVIESHNARDHEHEVILAHAEQDTTSQVYERADDEAITEHKQEKQLHEQHASYHYEMKQRQLTMMTLVNELYKSVKP